MPPLTTILDDADFLRENYHQYFMNFVFLERTENFVKFSIEPIGNPGRLVTVELNRMCFRIVRDTLENSGIEGKEYVRISKRALFRLESFEQVLQFIMGGKAFTDHILKLAIEKMNSAEL